MPKRKGIIFIITGVVLMLSALLLFLYNDYEDKKAGRKAEAALQEVMQQIEEKKDAPEELSVVEINGYGYIGYVSIPKINIVLPVMAEWDYTRLQVAPCRQMGSPLQDDFVIAAHNYDSHFSRLSSLNQGDAVHFVDMDGRENMYLVADVDKLNPKAVKEVLKSEYDLVLYTCDAKGSARVVAFCDRVEN